MTRASAGQYLRRKAVLLPILVSALWLLSDNETSYNKNSANSTSSSNHHLAVVTALHRHPPCLRVYRALLEFNLMLWCLAVSLLVWRRTVGDKMIGHLLFLPADHDTAKDFVHYTEASLGQYRPVNQDQQDDDKEEEDDVEKETFPMDEPVHQDDDNAEDDDKENMYPQSQAPLEVYRIDSTDDEPFLSPPVSNDNDSNVHDVKDDANDTPVSHIPLIVPPSPSDIANAALDSLLLILISLFLFTLSSAEGGRYVDGMAQLHTFKFIALVAAPLFPLITFAAGLVATVIPWRGLKGRKAQWSILLRTPSAPLFHVTFRDGFIGDILTSSVRPLQDVAFTLFYIASGLQGWWQQSYNWDDAASADAMENLPLESNWLLHTFVLPMCMASPLWWRFLQNLRQTYEYKTRWPYLGNALKYFIAAEVAVFGVYLQSSKQSFWWLSTFVVATLYQIWWDVFMDWSLLDVEWEDVALQDLPRWLMSVVTSRKDTPQFRSERKSSVLYLSVPVTLRLRPTRIYSVSWIYWSILVINIVLRFCWTLSFLPPHYLNRAGVLSETFEGDLSAILNPTIASAEIIRRTLWGWLRVEWEAIKVGRQEPRLKGAWRDGQSDVLGNYGKKNGHANDKLELKIMAMEGTMYGDGESRPGYDYEMDRQEGWRHQSTSPWVPEKMHVMTQMQILGELCIYATLFTGLGLLAAAHRDTL